MSYKIRPKQSMKYELEQTIICAGLKKVDLVKQYGVKHFKDLPEEIQQKHIIDYLFLENVNFFLKIISNVINADPKADELYIRNHIKGLIESTTSNTDIDPKFFYKH